MVPEMSFTWVMMLLIEPIASTAPFVSTLDGSNFAADIFGGFGGLLGQLFHFIGDHGKAFAGLSGACGFDGGV